MDLDFSIATPEAKNKQKTNKQKKKNKKQWGEKKMTSKF